MLREATFPAKWPLVMLNDAVIFLDNLRKPIKANERESGEYIYYGANGAQGCINDYIFDEPLILLAEDGGYFGDPDRDIAYIAKGKYWVNNHAHVLKPNTGVDLNFLYRVLQRYDVTPLIKGATRAKLTKGDACKIKIPLPPLEEQKRIAKILDKADAIRQKRQQAIELADEFLRSVFLDMFGPEVDKDNWPLVTFTDVTTIDAAMVDPRDDLYLDMLHIGPDRIEKNTGKLLPALTARDERLISKKFLFNEEYVLYSKIRPYLRKVALPNFTGLCSADMYPVKPTKNVMTREYLWQLLLSDAFTQYTETLPNRANIPKLNRAELASYEFKLPPMQLQNKFTDIYKKYSKSLLQLNKAQIKSESVFSSLNQKAFSGQL